MVRGVRQPIPQRLVVVRDNIGPLLSALVHRLGLMLQRLGGCGVLLDQSRILLRHLVHLAERPADLFDAGCLLGAGTGDAGDDIGDLVDRFHDIGERHAGAHVVVGGASPDELRRTRQPQGEGAVA